MADWTLDTLKEHFERVIADCERRMEERIAGQERAVTSAMTAADRAVIKAEVATEKRFESVNEFRAALTDNGRTLMPRVECENLMRALDQKAETAVKALAVRLDAVATTVVSGQSKTEGISAGWALASIVIGVVLTAISIAVLVYKSVPTAMTNTH